MEKKVTAKAIRIASNVIFNALIDFVKACGVERDSKKAAVEQACKAYEELVGEYTHVDFLDLLIACTTASTVKGTHTTVIKVKSPNKIRELFEGMTFDCRQEKKKIEEAKKPREKKEKTPRERAIAAAYGYAKTMAKLAYDSKPLTETAGKPFEFINMADWAKANEDLINRMEAAAA